MRVRWEIQHPQPRAALRERLEENQASVFKPVAALARSRWKCTGRRLGGIPNKQTALAIIECRRCDARVGAQRRQGGSGVLFVPQGDRRQATVSYNRRRRRETARQVSP